MVALVHGRARITRVPHKITKLTGVLLRMKPRVRCWTRASFAAATAKALPPGLHPSSSGMHEGPRTAFETRRDPFVFM